MHVCNQPQKPFRFPLPRLSVFCGGLSLIVTLVLSVTLAPSGVARADSSRAATYDHSVFDKILRSNVRRGRVNYTRIREKSKAALDKYAKGVGSASVSSLPRNERLAFYLNAYNALVIKAVIDNWPVTSVMKVKGFFDGKKHQVAGQALTLNALENKVIRPKFGDARIHFGLVCAARSCPPLTKRAFDGKTVQRQLDQLTREFLSKNKNGVQLKGSVAHISKLFEWYKDDFVKAAGSVKGYIRRYRNRDAVALGKATIAFQEYNWTLNGR